MIPPAMRNDLPRLRVPRGTRVTIRLSFAPSRWSGSLSGTTTRRSFVPARTAVWRATKSGILVVEARAEGRGSASYLVRLVVR
jgi:hypothetical protein